MLTGRFSALHVQVEFSELLDHVEEVGVLAVVVEGQVVAARQPGERVVHGADGDQLGVPDLHGPLPDHLAGQVHLHGGRVRGHAGSDQHPRVGRVLAVYQTDLHIVAAVAVGLPPVPNRLAVHVEHRRRHRVVDSLHCHVGQRPARLGKGLVVFGHFGDQVTKRHGAGLVGQLIRAALHAARGHRDRL
jgi:hypothetical protein